MAQSLVINVLDKQYYDDCHIKGSINIPLDQLESRAKELDKNQTIIVYCTSYSCSASRKAWHILNNMGFKDIYAYEGGMAEWYQMGFPIEGPAKKKYLMEPSLKPSEPEDPEVKDITAVGVLNKMG